MVGIAYVDGPRLRRCLMAAADWVATGREELHPINVFPVPDGDTGTNLALTLRAVAQALVPLHGAHFATVTAMTDGRTFSAPADPNRNIFPSWAL